ncbi:MAG: hypothetical protein JST84_06205 [Acidobacteria bacterium]|nr:hypothetical protein [Acidobacteriota bacterium]
MFIKVKDCIINTAHITHAEWRRINAGSPSETRNLHIYFALSPPQGSLSLREDEEVKKLWAYLIEQCQIL